MPFLCNYSLTFHPRTIDVLQQIECVHNNTVMELMRGVRSQLTDLISGLATQDLAPMSLGLSHSLSRYKLKFSPDKVSFCRYNFLVGRLSLLVFIGLYEMIELKY